MPNREQRDTARRCTVSVSRLHREVMKRDAQDEWGDNEGGEMWEADKWMGTSFKGLKNER